MKKIFILFLIWAGLTLFFFIIGKLIFPSDDLDSFITNGIKVEATVEKKEPDNHQHVIYTYTVNEKKYTGIGNAGYGNPGFENLQIGQKIMAYYDSNTPEKSILGNPKLYIKGDSNAIYFLTLIGPIFIIFELYRKRWI